MQIVIICVSVILFVGGAGDELSGIRLGAAMELWKQETVNGNACFSSGDLNAARVHYESACRRANQILYGWFNEEEMVAALVVSYQNRAELLFMQSSNTEALHQYHELHNILVAYRKHCSEKPQALRVIDSAFMRIKTELLYLLRLKGINTDYANSLVGGMSSKSILPKTTPHYMQKIQHKTVLSTGE